MPKGQHHKRLNSFAVLSTFNDLNTINAGNSLATAQRGLYWTRRGVTASNDKLAYGSLIMMQRSSYKPKMNSKTKCIKLTIGVAFPKECTKCPKGESSLSFREMCAEDTLFQVMDTFGEFRKYKLCKYGEGDEPNEEGYFLLHPNQLECYPEYSIKQDCGNLCPHLESQRSDVFIESRGVDDLVIAHTTITICDCYSDLTEFEWDWCTEDKDANIEGLVKCDTCDF